MMNTNQTKKRQLVTAILALLLGIETYAQVPPANKYDTSSYPEDRKAIELLNRKNDSTRFYNDDYIAVGPEGRISYGFDEWKKGFQEEGATFKSAKPVPGTTTLRIYNGDAAVKTFVLDVVFATTKGDFPIRVVRTETYIKQKGQWYFVAGQGTRVLAKEEYDEHMKR
jgi:ketosteroid isomerase-like protein